MVLFSRLLPQCRRQIKTGAFLRLIVKDRNFTQCFLSTTFDKGPNKEPNYGVNTSFADNHLCNDTVEGATGENRQGGEDDDDDVGYLQQLLERFGFHVSGSEKEREEKPAQLLDEVTFDGVAKYIQSEKCQKVVVMAGAGLSTAAGIPDFRTPGSGLYDNLQQYNLPYPEAIFELGFFHHNPEPFFKLAKELFPGNFKPTTSHYFLKLLHNKGLLLRHYTQNIDSLERIAGVPEEKIVHAHGTSYTGHCVKCRKLYDINFLKREIFADKIPTCENDECEGVVKPDIVFFGESLPERFSHLLSQDMPACDLLIIMGTSLAVQPFASLVDHVPNTTPRLLINREKCGQGSSMHFSLFGLQTGLMFDDPQNYRDVAWLGSCDDGSVALADLLGWKDELLQLVETGNKAIDEERQAENAQLQQNVEKQTNPENDNQQNTEENEPELSKSEAKTSEDCKSDEPATENDNRQNTEEHEPELSKSDAEAKTSEDCKSNEPATENDNRQNTEEHEPELSKSNTEVKTSEESKSDEPATECPRKVQESSNEEDPNGGVKETSENGGEKAKI